MSTPEYLDYNQASEYLGIPRKCLENYTKVGGELETQRVGRRNLFARVNLDRWRTQRHSQEVSLDRADYLRCLDFAINSFYRYPSTSDFGSAQQRDAGKFISNFVIGKLGEIAVKKFLEREFQVEVRLDFEMREAVVGQDIGEIARQRRGGRVYNPPRLRIAIKTTKLKNVWLVVPRNEAEDTQRYSDIYILSRVDLHLNHMIRLLRDHESLAHLADTIPVFGVMIAEVCGFVEREFLLSTSVVDQLPSPRQDIQPSYIRRSGDLKSTRSDWQRLVDRL